MRLFSNLESVRCGEPSMLAIVETVVACGLSFWLAWRFGSIQHIVVASGIAPFLLLRTRLSTWYTLRLSYESSEFVWPFFLPLIKFLATMIIVMHRPIRSVRAIPHNFFKNIAVIDFFFAPQFIPGSEEIRKRTRSITRSDVYRLLTAWPGLIGDLIGLQKKRGPATQRWIRLIVEVVVMTIVFVTCISLIVSAFAFRWALKSTAVLWLPLIWIVIQARPGTDVYTRLRVMTRSYWAKTMLAYSAVVSLAFVAKLALLFGIWQLADLDWLGPLGVAATRLAAPFELPLWQVAGAVNALLAWLFFFHADQHLLVQRTTEAWSEVSVRREYAIFQVVRTTLTLYVIACTFYITAAVAWRTEWPPIRFVLFPW